MAVNASALCLTPECIQISAHIQQFLSPNYKSIDPCVDFDQFVCGGFPTQFPDKKSPFSPAAGVINANEYILKAILDTDYPTVSQSSSDGHAVFEKLQQNYAACMDTTSLEAQAQLAFSEISDEIKSLFPVSDYASNATMSIATDDHVALAKLQVYLNTIGSSVLTKYTTMQDPQDPITYIPVLQAADFTNLENLLKSGATTELIAAMERVLPNGTTQAVVQQVGQSIAVLLEQIDALAKSLPTIDASSVKNVSVSTLGSLAPALAIDQVFAALVPSEYPLEYVGVLVPEIWTNMSTILEAAPKATIQSLILLSVYIDINSISKVSTTGTDRWKATCFKHIDTTLPWAAAKFWLDAAYNEDIGKAASVVIEDLRSSFDSRIDNNVWMSNATRALAKEKLAKIRKNVAYPTDYPNAINASSVEAFYRGFTVGPSHVNNTLSWRQWDSARTWNLLTHPAYEWPSPDHTYLVNAAYSPTENSIYFPAGIMRFPFFTPTLPSYINYGAFGSISGHELTHGFDDSGRKYNDVGALTPGQWDNETVAQFTERTECFISQFGNMSVYADYPVAGGLVKDPKTNGTLYVDGKQTLDENIADAGGVATAWAAWSARKDAEPEKNLLLPGLEDLTPEQLFFVAFGQFFCHRVEAAGLVEQVSGDEHSPNFARNMGIMENSQGFREAFKCKLKEPVCELW